MIERYIWGLSDDIQGNVTSSKPQRIREAIRIAHNLMDQRVRAKADKSAEKRGIRRTTKGAMFNNQTKDKMWLRLMICEKAPSLIPTPVTATAPRALGIGYFGYGVQGHYMSECLKAGNQNKGNQQNRGGAHGRVFMLARGEAV
ncbi:hypothetical protein Tco_1340161 [Tanacetum coccineum]